MHVQCDEKAKGILIPPLKHLSTPVSLDKASVDEKEKKKKKVFFFFIICILFKPKKEWCTKKHPEEEATVE